MTPSLLLRSFFIMALDIFLIMRFCSTLRGTISFCTTHFELCFWPCLASSWWRCVYSCVPVDFNAFLAIFLLEKFLLHISLYKTHFPLILIPMHWSWHCFQTKRQIVQETFKDVWEGPRGAKSGGRKRGKAMSKPTVHF